MTVVTEVQKEIYEGPSSGPFSIPFAFSLEEDIRVIYTNAVGTEETLVQGTSYNITGVSPTAFVVYPVVGDSHTTLAANEKLTILRIVPLTQGEDFPSQSSYFLQSLEDGVDKLTYAMQQINEVTSRSITYDISYNGEVLDAVSFITAITEAANTICGGNFALPDLTTAERDLLTPTGSWMIYNITEFEVQRYDMLTAAWVGIGGGTSELTVDRATHGWVAADLGRLVRKGTGVGLYEVALADSPTNAEVIGFISRVISANSFKITKEGSFKFASTAAVDALCGTTGGFSPTIPALYWLDTSLTGSVQYTTTAPVGGGGTIQLPAFTTLSETEVWFHGQRGIAAEDNSIASTFTNADLTAGVLTFTHNLNNQTPFVVVYNNTNKIIVPDNIEGVSVNSSSITLTSYGTLIGTWTVLAIGGGGASTAIDHNDLNNLNYAASGHIGFQSQAIVDAEGYFEDDTVEGALSENGRYLTELTASVALQPLDVTDAVVAGVWTITITQPEGLNLEFNIGMVHLTHTSDVMTVDATSLAGTDLNPTNVYVYVVNTAGAPVLTASNTFPTGIEHVGISIFKAGLVSASSITQYASFDTNEEVYEFMDKVYRRIYDEGSLYVSGLAPTVTATNATIGSGMTKTIFNDITIDALTVGTDGLTFIKSDGTFNTQTDFAFTEYSTGQTITVNKYYSVVLGVVADNPNRIYAMVQRGDIVPTGKEYKTVSEAIEDRYGALMTNSNDSVISKMFVPVCRVVVLHAAATDELQELPEAATGVYYMDMRGYRG